MGVRGILGGMPKALCLPIPPQQLFYVLRMEDGGLRNISSYSHMYHYIHPCYNLKLILGTPLDMYNCTPKLILMYLSLA